MQEGAQVTQKVEWWKDLFSNTLFNTVVPGWSNEAQAVISMPYVCLVKLPLCFAAVTQNNQLFKSSD